MQIFVALAVPFVDGRSKKTTYTDFASITGGPSLIKTYQLLSSCSGKLVQMKFNKVINARGVERSCPYTLLNFLSDTKGSGAIRIKGDAIKMYLCFNRKGILINRAIGDDEKCMFNEVPHQNFIMLQSVANSKWYVGFTRKGKKAKGYAKKDRWRPDRCFKFLKTEWNSGFSLGDRSQAEMLENSVSNSIEHGKR